MAELAVKEITELKGIEFTDDALLLAYTEKDGVGKTTFAEAKELIGSDINIEQTKTASGSGGENEITATIRNGKTTSEKTFKIKNGTGLESAEKEENTDINGLRSTSVTLKSSDSNLVPDMSFTVKDGVGVKTVTQTTASTLSGEKNEYTISLTDGTTSKIQVYNGRAGKDFRIKKTYTSITEMENDFSGTDVDTFEFALIDTGSVEDEDTGKLYCKGDAGWSYIGDLSGKQGIKGEPGNGVKSASTTYQLSTSGAAIPTGVWSDTPLAPTETQYLWTKTVTTYTDGTSSTAYSVGGICGVQPKVKAAAGANIGSVGTPTATATTSGTTTTFTFDYLKGAKGDKGDAGVWNGKVPTSQPSTLENGMIWIE